MAQPTIKAKDIIGQSLERNRFFYGKLMRVRDFDQEQEHFTAKRWIINRILFGSGVMCGLQVENSAAAPATIEIKPGVAIDPLGREVTVVEIPGGNKFDLTKVIPVPSPPPAQPFTGDKKGFICLSYHECPKEPVPSLKYSSCDETCESNRLRETFDVSWDEGTSTTPSPSLCEKWLNRTTVTAEDAKFRIERATPVWVRAGEVFEVSVRVTAEQDATNVQITETRTGGSLIEPTPAQSATGQFPTPPVNLKAGEFFVYVYQVKSPAAAGAFELSLSTGGLPAPTSKVEVLSEADAKLRESELTIESNCGEPTESCVRIAELTVHFTASKPDKIIDIKGLGSPRFRYSLERVTELLDCLRASLLSEAGSARPGHLFVTFNDRETKDPKPIGPIASPGTTPTFASGAHAHVLLRHEPSGLQFTGAGNNELWVNGNVGGESINFLNTVSGQAPVLPAHLVTKAYVDAGLAGLDWMNSVLDKDLTAPPASPKPGDRYLLFNEKPTGAWKGQQNNIATFNNNKGWDFATPNEGAATFVEDDNIAYLFVDGSWIPFLAAPSVTAGDGLIANGAVLAVGRGRGILVNPDDVAIAFETKLPQPIGPVGSASAGSSDFSNRSDHSHGLPLSKAGGLVFAEGGLSINGPVAGTTIDFLNVVSGQTPTSDRHIATKAYVDGKVALPPKVVAGAGLFFDPAGALAVGAGQGIIVGDDLVFVRFSDTVPRPGSDAGDPGKDITVPRADHSHPQQSITAGDGLVATGTVVSVGKGKGMQINPDDVAIAFETKLPQPIGPVGSASAGSSDFSNRSDHSHGLPLSKAGGLVFAEGGLNINGPVAGTTIDFLSVVSGQTPTSDRHIATKAYVDGKVTLPPKVVAGAGLFFDSAGALAVGGGPGIIVGEDLVSVRFSAAVPQPIGPAGSAGSSDTPANSGHSHGLPLSKAGGLVFAADGGLSINGPVAGTTIDFLGVVSGQTPTSDRHIATKAYVDGKVGSPPKVIAGAGLIFDPAGALAVGAGPGIIVAEDSVSVRFSSAVPLPNSESGNPGGDGTLSQGNHVHPVSPLTPLASTGLVTFKISGQAVTAQSGLIDPGLGKGPISVQLAFVIAAANTFVFGPAGVFQADIPQLSAAANSSGLFQILVTALPVQRSLPSGFSVRWFAYRPGVEGKQVDVVISPNSQPNA